jgi:uncharacterized membrane protein
MSDEAATATRVEPVPGLLRLTHVIYGLHSLSVLIGLFSFGLGGAASHFVVGLPSIAAVILNYARRAEARNTWLESHFRWQIRTFWFSWLWILVVSVIAAALLILLVGFVIAVVGYALIGAWIIYRVARGWLALREGRPMPLAPV